MRRPLAVILASVAGGAVLIELLYDGPIAAFAAGAWCCLGLALATEAIVSSADRAYHRIQGAAAEGYTAEVFRSRKRRRAGWRIVHDLMPDRHQVDHVAVGPTGVFAIETKWVNATPWRVVGSRLVGPVGDPIAQAQRSARKVTSLLASVEPGPRIAVPAVPVLVVWGPGAPDLDPAGVLIEGVRVVGGTAMPGWPSLFDAAPALDPGLQAAVTDKLRRFGAMTRAAEAGSGRGHRQRIGTI